MNNTLLCHYLEEEQKRLQQKSNEFQYSYEGGEKSVEDEEEGPQLHEQQPVIGVEEKPFAPSPELDVPADIAIVNIDFINVGLLMFELMSFC